MEIVDLTDRVCPKCGLVVGDSAVHERREAEFELLRQELAAVMARE